MQRMEILKGDITTLSVDAIVNAANKTLLGGGGVDGAIHRVAGPELLEECKSLNGCETGQAKITKGYNLKAKYVIHTVGPVYGRDDEPDRLLEYCYKNSLELAKKYNIHSIAFPCISTGAYAYPLSDATVVAIVAVKAWLRDNSDYDITVIFCCFDEESYEIYKNFLTEEGWDNTNKDEPAYPLNVVRSIFGIDSQDLMSDKAKELLKNEEFMSTYQSVLASLDNPEYVAIIEGWYRDGKSIEALAKELGVDRETLNSEVFPKILRKLRHPAYSKRLLQYRRFLTEKEC